LYEWVNCSLELLSEKEELGLIVDGQHTSTGDTTENVGTSTLEERLDTLSGDDLLESIEGRLVLDGLDKWLVSCIEGRGIFGTYLSGGHHHTTTDGIERVRGNTGTSGDSPTESEGSKEVTLKGTDEEDRLDGIVQSEVETTVNDDTSDGRHETTVQSTNTIGSEGLLVDIDQTVELTLTTGLGVLGIVGKTGTGVIEGVDEEEGSGTSHL
jgi:hypothetical protein